MGASDSTGGLLIGGRWRQGRGDAFRSSDPATGNALWEGRSASADDVHDAVDAAGGAGEAWSSLMLEARLEIVEAFGAALERRRDEMARAISREVGKPLWESRAEVGSMIGKIEVSRTAYQARCGPIQAAAIDANAVARFRPHGVMAVFGPFNFPGHLPNGHVVPALIAGNTVVLKPSEHAPGIGAWMAALWREVGLPGGVLNLVQGAADTGRALAGADIDGLLFTGSHTTGLALAEQLARRSGVLLALEMGGNNPLVVHDSADLDAAAVTTIRSAFASAGQRCTCARRLIVPRGAAGDAFVARLAERIGRIGIGFWDDDPEPFMGPLINADAADVVLVAQAARVEAGADLIVEARRSDRAPALVTPGLIDVTGVAERADEEIFGPLLQLVRTDGFDAAVEEAAVTRFGLAAAILTDDRALYETFRRRVRAGCINWNRPTTGANSALPFGGVGLSGNHRPSAYLAADYCAYPVASIEAEALEPGGGHAPGLDS